MVKVAVDPVWFLPGIAKRFGTTETALRHALFEQTAGMFPELVTRADLQVFLPPIGGTTIYIFGDTAKLSDARTAITCRVHDECNGSDVFGSDICTCRPYLIHGIEECARMAQSGGLGVIVYNRKEGRALGEVTKFLVYNARKRQEGGDVASAYFELSQAQTQQQDSAHARHHPPADIPIHEKFYSNWMMPDRPTASCCNNRDCYPTEVRFRDGFWEARRREDGPRPHSSRGSKRFGTPRSGRLRWPSAPAARSASGR